MLAPWQEQALTEIFGWVDDDGNRIIEMAYMEVPKKAGKTEFAAGIVLLVLIMSMTPGTQVYGAAAATRQAMNVYRACCKMIEQSPILKARLRVLRGTNRILRRDDPDSFYAAIAADGDMGDGVNPSCVIADEVHRWKTRKQLENWDVLANGGITRKQTLTIAITTAGVQQDSPLAWKLHEKSRKLQDGIVSDPKFYGRVYGASAEDDPGSPDTWRKANPSLIDNGGFLDIEKVREKYVAHVAEGDLTSFKRYYLNIWDQKENRAIDMAKWDASSGGWVNSGLLEKCPEDTVRPISRELLARFIERDCWVGVDLSQTTDLSAVVFVFPGDGGTYELLPFFYLPGDAIAKRQLRDGMPYKQWVDQGFIEVSTVVPGVVDLEEVQARIEWGARMFMLHEVIFDPWNAGQISVQLVKAGITCLYLHQQFAHLSEPSKKLLELVETGRIHHGGHPILRWNASCVVKKEFNDNMKFVKPEREKSSSRIDGISAAVNGLSRAMLNEKSVYTTRGILAI